VTIPEQKKKLPIEDPPKREDTEAKVSPSESNSLQVNDSTGSVKTGKTIDSNANSEDSSGWKRSGSLRTRNSCKRYIEYLSLVMCN